MENDICEHGTEAIYRCPDNADHDDVEGGILDKPGFCPVCGVEMERV